MNIAAAIKKFVNSKNPAQDGFMPLDELFEKKTGVRIQTVNMTLADTRITYYANITEVDTSKSIAIITSYINGIKSVSSGGTVHGIQSVNVWFNNSSQIAARATNTRGTQQGFDLPITVTVIEFGATVDKG